jgi:uncharacterized C2H2 Zn-finger protein
MSTLRLHMVRALTPPSHLKVVSQGEDRTSMQACYIVWIPKMLRIKGILAKRNHLTDFLSEVMRRNLLLKLTLSSVCIEVANLTQLTLCIFFISQIVTGAETLLHGQSQTSGKESFQCPDCGRCYLHRRSLWRHMKLECGKEPMFQCPHCPKRTKLKENLKQHIVIVHGSLFTRNKLLQKHTYRFWNCYVFILYCQNFQFMICIKVFCRMIMIVKYLEPWT